MPELDNLLAALCHAENLAPDAFNPYAPPDPFNALRLENFRLYLRHCLAHPARVMLLMEAPGYRGCRLTGVPVTSRRILLEGVPGLDVFGAERGYQDVPEPGFEVIQGEQSATILWSTLAELQVMPLVWNTFPFHPHKSGNPLSNRKPRTDEIRAGAVFMRAAVTLFQPQQIIAVGNVAESALLAEGLPHVKVRHPAQGGKNDFVAGLRHHLG